MTPSMDHPILRGTAPYGPDAPRDSPLYFATEMDEMATPASVGCRASYGLLLFDRSFRYVLCCRQRYSLHFRALLAAMHRGRPSYGGVAEDSLDRYVARLPPRELGIIGGRSLFIEAVSGVYASKMRDRGAIDANAAASSHVAQIMRRYGEVAGIARRMHGAGAMDDEKQWSPPKGGAAALPAIETCIEAAMRETREETLLDADDYAIVSEIPPIVRFYSRADDVPTTASSAVSAVAAGSWRAPAASAASTFPYHFAIVLYTAVLNRDAYEKIDGNMASIIARQEIDNVALQPVSGLAKRLPSEYGSVIEYAATLIANLCIRLTNGETVA